MTHKSRSHTSRLLVVLRANPEASPLCSFSGFTAPITAKGSMNLYSLPPSKATGTLINLTTCYCQVEHIHLVSQSVYSSIPLWVLPFRPYFVTFKETLSCLSLSCYTFSSWSESRLSFSLSRLLYVLLISLFIECQHRVHIACTLRCHRRLNHSPRRRSLSYPADIFKKPGKRVLKAGCEMHHRVWWLGDWHEILVPSGNRETLPVLQEIKIFLFQFKDEKSSTVAWYRVDI